jgi:hypothetical protein
LCLFACVGGDELKSNFIIFPASTHLQVFMSDSISLHLLHSILFPSSQKFYLFVNVWSVKYLFFILHTSHVEGSDKQIRQVLTFWCLIAFGFVWDVGK